MEYTGNLYQDIVDMDFIDDPPEISEQERFQRHNRFLRSLKSDTLLIIDNFNVTSTQDSCLSVVLKYRCRVLFTTRSQLSEYCSFQLKELKDIPHSFSTDICILFRSRGKPGNRRKNHRNCTLPYFCCRTGSQTSGKWNFNSRAIIDKTSRGKGFSS